MRNRLPLFLVFALLAFGFESAFAEDTRLSSPNYLGVEVLGRGLLYSVDYDRVISDDLVVGGGFGSSSTKYANGGASTGTTALVIPAYANFYFVSDQISPFVTGGADIVANANSVTGYSSNIGGLTFPSNGIIGTFGAGFEDRSDAGFLARAAVYGLVGHSVVPWVGLSFGLAF